MLFAFLILDFFFVLLKLIRGRFPKLSFLAWCSETFRELRALLVHSSPYLRRGFGAGPGDRVG